MMNAAFGWLAQCNRHLQCPDCQVTFHAIADCPANHPPRMQIKNDSQVEPSFSRPDIADVTCPLLVRLIGMEVPVQQVRRDIESVIAIRCDLVFFRPLNADAILAHQSANPAMTDVQTHLLQFFGHAWTAIAAQAETGLFLAIGGRFTRKDIRINQQKPDKNESKRLGRELLIILLIVLIDNNDGINSSHIIESGGIFTYD